MTVQTWHCTSQPSCVVVGSPLPRDTCGHSIVGIDDVLVLQSLDHGLHTGGSVGDVVPTLWKCGSEWLAGAM